MQAYFLLDTDNAQQAQIHETSAGNDQASFRLTAWMQLGLHPCVVDRKSLMSASDMFSLNHSVLISWCSSDACFSVKSFFFSS